MKKRIVNITVNGVNHELLIAPNQLLLEVLREDLTMTGTKFGCELGECGVCTVLIDGTPALSCSTLACLCDGMEITTIEGLTGKRFDIIKQAFADAGASQCGYCTPSMVVMLYHLMGREQPLDIREELSGNLCRCTGYVKILDACERSLELAKD